MNKTEGYSLLLESGNQKIGLDLKAYDTAHAAAQSVDICRALKISKYSLIYSTNNEIVGELSELFNKLAFSDFSKKDCCLWQGKHTNGYPCIYAQKKKFYVRSVILNYLDIDPECTVKVSCNNKSCINPYHFEYYKQQNSKLNYGDERLLVAYKSQKVKVAQIAEMFNVHRATVYRKMKQLNALEKD